MKKKKTLLLIAILCVSISCYAQGSKLNKQKVSASTEKQIDSIFNEFNNLDSPGVAIAVLQNGEEVFLKGYGSANIEHRIPINPKTSVFNIASTSKQVTAFAVLLLAEKNKLSLDDDVHKYIPELHDFGHKITLRDLVNHTSGIRSELQLLAMASWMPGDVITRKHILQMIYQQKELNFKPREEWDYSNSGFTLLSEVVERVSGKTFIEFTNENIFKPLEMSNSSFNDNYQNIIKNVVSPYQFTGELYRKNVTNDGYAGSTGLFTTAEDFSKWALNFREQKVGTKKTFEEMNKMSFLENGNPTGYAFGQFIEEYKGLRQFHHGGNNTGFVAYLGRFPEQDFSIILLGNSSSINIRGKSMEVANLFLKTHFKVKKPSTNHNKAKNINLSSEQLIKYTGNYWNEKDSYSRSIIIKNNSLIYSRGGGNESKLTPIDNNLFQMQGTSVDLKVEFLIKGKKKSMTIFIDGKKTDLLENYTKKQFNSEQLEQFQGTYYSDELKTFYKVEIEQNTLVVKHIRIGDIPLTAIKGDIFSSKNWRFNILKFKRNASGKVIGIRISSTRVKNLLFKRLQKS